MENPNETPGVTPTVQPGAMQGTPVSPQAVPQQVPGGTPPRADMPLGTPPVAGVPLAALGGYPNPTPLAGTGAPYAYGAQQQAPVFTSPVAGAPPAAGMPQPGAPAPYVYTPSYSYGPQAYASPAKKKTPGRYIITGLLMLVMAAVALVGLVLVLLLVVPLLVMGMATVEPVFFAGLLYILVFGVVTLVAAIGCFRGNGHVGTVASLMMALGTVAIDLYYYRTFDVFNLVLIAYIVLLFILRVSWGKPKPAPFAGGPPSGMYTATAAPQGPGGAAGDVYAAAQATGQAPNEANE